MKFIELQEAFEIEINKIDANFEKPKSIDIEYWLNKGLEKFYKTRYSGINYKSTGFEQDQKRIDDLRSLIETQQYTLDDDTYYLIQQNGSKIKLHSGDSLINELQTCDKIHAQDKTTFYVQLPKHYVLLLGDTAGVVPLNAADIECAEKDEFGNVIPKYSDTLEATVETVDRIKNNSLSEYHFKYLRARPIRLQDGDKIVLFTDGNYCVKEYKITYLRYPNKIDIHRYPFDEYTDMPVHTHGEIIKFAVQLYLENQKDSRYNTYTTEVNLME